METFNFQIQEDINDEVQDFDVEYYFTPIIPAVNFLSNGDYGHPEEGGDLEIVSIIDTVTGNDVTETVDPYIFQKIVNTLCNYEQPRPLSKLFELPRFNRFTESPNSGLYVA